MIKPKYPKRADLSQIARSIVEHATGESLTPSTPDAPKVTRPLERHKADRKSRNYKTERPK